MIVRLRICLLVLLLLLTASCATNNPPLVRVEEIPPADKLPIDGVWLYSEGNGGSLRIDSGRAYYLAGRSNNILFNSEEEKVGSVIIRDIKMKRPRVYDCNVCVIYSKGESRSLIYSPGRIYVMSEERLKVQTYPNLSVGLYDGTTDYYDLVSLDDDDAFLWCLNNNYIAPPASIPTKEFTVTHFDYDNDTHKGEISVDSQGRGIKCREWLVQNIGAICSSKNTLLEAGSESKKGGHYRILDENLEDDILTVHFESAW